MIHHLCDHHGEIFRPRGPEDATTRDELGDVLELFDALPAPAGLNCRGSLGWSGDLQDPGPGEQQSARREWFLVPEFDVQERDVLSITEGPNAPVLLRVLSVARCTAPVELHHYEVNVEVWQGVLTEAEASSS